MLIVGTLFHIFGLMMLSLSKQYYQVVLSQGLCSPIGAGLLYNTGKPLMYSSYRLETVRVNDWASSGICSTTMVWEEESIGNGHRAAGRIVWKYYYSYTCRACSRGPGFPWAVRITAFIYLVFCVGVMALR